MNYQAKKGLLHLSKSYSDTQLQNSEILGSVLEQCCLISQSDPDGGGRQIPTKIREFSFFYDEYTASTRCC